MTQANVKNLNRREFLSLAAGSAMTAALPFGGCHKKLAVHSSSQARQPNIIFLLTDDQRWDAMSCAGNRILKTPNMDKLAAEGTMFENAFVTTAICMASRASIMTGLYERRHQCNFNTGDLHPSLFEKSYPVLLRKAGYHTGFIGKFGFALSNKKVTDNSYVDTWYDLENIPTDAFDKWYGFAGQGEYFPKDKGGKHLTRIMTEQAIEFLNERPGDRPFCLSISYKAPHGPFTPDPKYDNLYKDDTIPVPRTARQEYLDNLPEPVKKGWGHVGYWKIRYSTPESYQDIMKKYYRLIAGVDESIGKIRRELKKLSLDDNTVIILLGDNGEFESEHLLGGKALLYEESIRVPLIVYDPRVPKTARGQRRKELALNIDIAPTLMALAGLEIPDIVQGRNLLPIVQVRNIRWRRDILCENLFRLGEWEDKPAWLHQYYPMCEAVRTQQYKYIRYSEFEPLIEELFDLENDPQETVNMANNDKYQQTLKALRRRCDELVRQAKGH